MNKNSLINSIFYPRSSFIPQDEKDILITVENGVEVGVRLFLKGKLYPTILYFHGNAELAQEYESVAKMYNNHSINLIVSDYRKYGLSGGIPDKDNLHSDSVKIFDYIKAGIPVVSSNLVELTLIIKQYKIGLVIKNHDPKEILNTIIRVVNDQGFKNNTEKASKELIWENEVVSLLNIYKQIG